VILKQKNKTMETKIIKGDLIREKIFAGVKAEIAELDKIHNRVPGIAFIGFDGIPLGKYNIPLHVQSAESLGFKVALRLLPETVPYEEVVELIRQLNSDDAINAIVLLQPLPPHLNPIRLISHIDPEKEVEGFHPKNMMSVLIPETGISRYPMCLPAALKEMFRESGINTHPQQEWVFLVDEGFLTNTLTHMIVRTAAAQVVPLDNVLSFVNKDSNNLKEFCHRADYLVVVSKNTEFVQKEWLKPGVCIIDIYSNLVKEVPSKNDPARLVPVIRGGVNLESVLGHAGAILPIPGGLMTVVMGILFRNAVISFKWSLR